jgi:mevalonate kinase
MAGENRRRGSPMAVGQGKLLLFGEHAAVQGYPAAGVPLPLGVSFQEVPWQGEAFPGIPQKYHQALIQMIGTIADLGLEAFPQQNSKTYLIESQLPLGSGFGSSGALSTAVARFYHPGAGPEEIWQLANRGESIFHGSPSGIDTGLSVYNQALAFFFEGAELPRIQELPHRGISLVVSAVPREKDTYTYVSHVKALCQDNPRAADQLETLGALSRTYLSSSDLDSKDMGLMAQRAAEILSAWNLVPEALERMIRSAGAYGSTGGKISGAGGGGAFFLVAENQDRVPALIDFLRHSSQNSGLPLLIEPFEVKI